jgi:hypothetical protein
MTARDDILTAIGGITVHPAQGVTTLTVVLSPRTPHRSGEPNAR